jgi:formate transporter
MPSQMFGFDAFSPKQVAEKVQDIGVTKARLPLLPMLMLSIMAGVFIGLGAVYFTVVNSDSSLGFAAGRVLGGVVFSLGLILVVLAGAELFTGNNFLVMAWADGKIRTLEIARNWGIVYLGNFVGAFGIALLVVLANHGAFGGGTVGMQAIKIAAAKTALPLSEAFWKGVLCNLLVCLGIWISTAGRTVIDKIIAIVFPISAFVAAGFEHSVANMYFIIAGMLFANTGALPPGVDTSTLNVTGMVHNLIPVTLGNIFGGSVLVALGYYVIYRRGLHERLEIVTPAAQARRDRVAGGP